MMSVKEYAADTGYSVAEILKKCEELGINVKNADADLSEDDIIVLDNTINLISTEHDASIDEEEAIDEVVDSIMENSHIEKAFDTGTRTQKLKKRSQVVNSKEDYLNKRKEMYKNKEKLQGNAEELDKNLILYSENMTVADFANILDVSGTELIKKLMVSGLMLTLKQTIDFENAEILALEYGKTLKKEETQDISNFEEFEILDSEEDLEKRPPVITIMGHVDHGKTSLLDYIRNAHVVDGEFGGITQHIGAYQVNHNGEKLTFIDTPGHAAFTEMRARGASVTDIVIIIVAADDGVMPQTKEAVDHATSAGAPIVVAINKMDKPSANPERIMQGMAELNITPEEWGGNIPFVRISAATGEGIDELLETLIAISEMNNLKANPKRYAIGSVIESKVDKNIGGVASLLIQNGTLRLGDPIVVGTSSGKVRTMRNDLGESIVEAGPSSPVEITGLSETPSAGDKFMAFETENQSKEIANKRAVLAKLNNGKKTTVSLDDLFAQIEAGCKEINVVLKADVRGSEEAVKNALEKIDVEGAIVKVIRSGIGAITESDIVLANASNAIVVGFNVVPNAQTKEIAKEYDVEMRLYTIIYKAVEEMELAMKGILDPQFEEKIIGTAEVRKIFTFSKVGKIAGSYVVDGVMKNNAEVRVIRDGVIIYTGKIANLQREKDTVKEVKKGFECGLTFENYSDLKERDIVEAFEMQEVKI